MWTGAAVMGALLVHIAFRGPENTAPTVTDETGPAEALAAR